VVFAYSSEEENVVNLRIAGPNKPLLELANIDYTYSGGGSGVTGDGTPYTCLWNTPPYGYNADFVGQTFPGSGQAGKSQSSPRKGDK
jgi:hypothetical protein